MNPDMSVLYKVLNENRMPFHGGNGQWPYRKWTPRIQPVPCIQGYHVCRIDQLLNWLGPKIWVVEIRGEWIDHSNKLVAESARLVCLTKWNERNARLFAADCAEHVLPIWESEYPNDDRPRQAIEVSRQFAEGNVSAQTWSAAESAAWSAAESAARSAAWSAAESAERQWQAERIQFYL